MKKLLSVSLIVLIFILTLTACNNDETVTERVTLYTVEGAWLLGGSWIYDYNKNADYYADTIDIITFESDEALKEKLSSELMAGKGPDLILDSTMLMAELSDQKLIETDSFLDLNKLDLDLNDYSQNILDNTLVDGKRIYIPAYYTPKFWICSEEDLEGIQSGDVLSYDELIKLSESTDKKLFSESDYASWFALYYVQDSIDFDNKSFNFDSEKFKSTVENLRKMNDIEKAKSGEEYIFSTYASSPYDIYAKFAEIENEGKTPAIVGEPSLNEKLSAYFTDAIFVNKNCDKNKFDKVKKIIEFVVSEGVQNETTGAEISQYNPLFSYTSGILFPTNAKSFETLMNSAYSFSYNTSGEYEPNGSSKPRTDEPQTVISDKSKKLLHDKLNSIEQFQLGNYYVRYNIIVQDIIEEYYNGNITTDKLISQLSSKTKIFLEE